MRFVALGEILFDRFPDRAVLGGAPGNVCCMMRQFGAEAFPVSAVGDDEAGREARRQLAAHGLHLDGVQTATAPTGAVHVTLDAAGKASYRFDEDSAYDHIVWDDTLAQLAQNADAVIWGTLAQRKETSRRTIRRFLRSTRPECLRIFDVNLRKPYFNAEVIQESVKFADVVKLNDEELPVLAGFYRMSPDELIPELFAEGVSVVALSLGKEGAELHCADGSIDRAPAAPQEHIVDTVGAGDSYTATLIYGLLERRPLAEINRHANRVAAHVCGCRGATPELPEELRRF